MQKTFFYIFLLLAGVTFDACGSNDDNNKDSNSSDNQIETFSPVVVTKTNSMKVFVHYMPWFETPATNNGSWGQHWTMANCNPEKIDASGKRQIASYYYPLTGPYASSDSTLLDYQCLLMKYSGIDGVMIDWYGTQSKNDYASNKKNTEAIVKSIEKAGLQFAIVYEDNTLNGLDDKVSQARLDIRYLASGFFKSNSYIKIDAKPLLMIFGPQQISKPEEWNDVFNVLLTKPEFIVLNGNTSKVNNSQYINSQGEFLWVNANPSYSDAKNYSMYIGGAMPGFHDYYKAGGWGNGYTTYDSENGALFDRQLSAAKNAGLGWLQVSTWNDYGEGTNIEPTQEYGYQYLVKIQQFTGVSYQQSVLENIYRWYQLKGTYSKDKTANSKLLQCYYYFISLQPDKAKIIMDKL